MENTDALESLNNCHLEHRSVMDLGLIPYLTPNSRMGKSHDLLGLD